MKCNIHNPTPARRVIHLGTDRDSMLAIQPGETKYGVDVPDHVVKIIRARKVKRGEELVFSEPTEPPRAEPEEEQEEVRRPRRASAR